ncbi:MAG: YkgJ family cysteine cluster protein [Candidatus Cloacimonadota bacterium]|nr:YkgJ family cysteine cluster protein [Candidatus Cloacimonadota bacterium]
MKGFIKYIKKSYFKLNIYFKKQHVSIVGSCNQCGNCCRDLYLYYGTKQITSEKLFRKLKKIDPEFKHFHVNRDSKSSEISFYCDKIDNENKCTIYEDRPSFCKDYPTTQILKYDKRVLNGCGYSAKKSIKFEDYLKLKMNS